MSDFLRRLVASIDFYLFMPLMLLLVISCLLIASASAPHLQNHFYHLIIAAILLLIMTQVPSSVLLMMAPILYFVGLALLLALFEFGDTSKGAQRWLDLKVIRLQPSELMRIGVPLVLAWWFHVRTPHNRFLEHCVALILLVVPAYAIYLQPDLGTALLISAAGLVVIYFAGLPWKFIVWGTILVLACLPFFWQYALQDYQRSRVLTLFNQQSDPLGQGFHIIQSTIAIGSGGLFGKGWRQGTQVQLEFLPESHTDFILAVLAEEFGLAGVISLMVLYTILVIRCMVISLRAPTVFTRLLAIAFGCTLFTYVFVNVGMVSGLLPVVGLPLPFVSYGGTSLVILMCGMGVLMRIAYEAKNY